MADTEKKISELTSAAQVNDTDLTVLSQGSAGSGFSSVKATLLAIAQKIVTGINFTSNLHTTDKTVTGAINEVAADGNIAEPYDDTSTYEVGDYCIYQTTLYKCITAVSTAGAWDSTKWDAVLVTDEMGSSGSGGHTILNDSGTSLAQEDDLQFKGVYSHDDSTNEKTIVEVVREFQTESAITSLTGEEAKGFQAIINGNSYEPFKATDIGFNKTGTSFTSDDVDGVLREVDDSLSVDSSLNKTASGTNYNVSYGEYTYGRITMVYVDVTPTSDTTVDYVEEVTLNLSHLPITGCTGANYANLSASDRTPKAYTYLTDTGKVGIGGQTARNRGFRVTFTYINNG